MRLPPGLEASMKAGQTGLAESYLMRQCPIGPNGLASILCIGKTKCQWGKTVRLYCCTLKLPEKLSM